MDLEKLGGNCQPAMCTLLIPKRVTWHGLEIRPVLHGFRVLLHRISVNSGPLAGFVWHGDLRLF